MQKVGRSNLFIRFKEAALLSTNRAEVNGPGRTRTSDTRFRKPVLYPLSYEAVLGQG
jgi:hypothetical protein